MLVQIEARIARGQARGCPEAAPPTVAALIERFPGRASRPRIKDLAVYKAQAQVGLRRVLPQFGSLRADVVTAQDLARLRDHPRAAMPPTASATPSMSWGPRIAGAAPGPLLPVNPVRGLELPARVDSLDYLTADEVKALLAKAAELAPRSRRAICNMCVSSSRFTPAYAKAGCSVCAGATSICAASA